VLFLDEIGDMSLPLQSKLLHVLQGGDFTPLGSEKQVQTDVWVIAATNRDLKKEVEKGGFRDDLYYRLSTITIVLEPLRNRPEDMPGPPRILHHEVFAGVERQGRHAPEPGCVRQAVRLLLAGKRAGAAECAPEGHPARRDRGDHRQHADLGLEAHSAGPNAFPPAHPACSAM